MSFLFSFFEKQQVRYWKITGVRLTKTPVRSKKTGVRPMKTPVREVKTGVRLMKTPVRLSKTGVREAKTGVFGVKGSFLGCFWYLLLL